MTNIGEKIKAERTRLGLTQSAVAGDHMTRNMVSRLETGDVTPSVETLLYLSDVLKVPVGYLLDDGYDRFFYQKHDAMAQILSALREQRYADCYFLLSRFETMDDELHYLCALCAFEIGKKNVLGGFLVSAKKYLSESAQHLKKTAFPPGHLCALLPMYLAIADNIQSPLLEFDSKKYNSRLQKDYETDFFHYIMTDYEYEFHEPLFRMHAEAKNLMRQRKYQEAIRVLLRIEEDKNSDRYNAFVFLGVYTDLELCYKEIVDFEKAYRYLVKRVSLMEGFKF